MGDRMESIQPGAMPWLHRYVGNPVLTGILNLFFRTGVSDAHCGMRALRRDVLPRLDLRTTGMEFASEMVDPRRQGAARPHPAVGVAHAGAVEQVQDAGQHRVADVAVEPRHRAGLDALHAVAHDEVGAVVELLDEARDLARSRR